MFNFFFFKHGVTPLHVACKEGNLDIVKILFNHPKINKYAKTKNFCYTPFHFACQSGNIDLVQFIKSELKENININEGEEKHLLTPLHIASYSGQIDVVVFLLKQPNINVNSKSTISNEIEYIDLTPLHLACLNGKRKIVELLMNNSSIILNSVAIEAVSFIINRVSFY